MIFLLVFLQGRISESPASVIEAVSVSAGSKTSLFSFCNKQFSVRNVLGRLAYFSISISISMPCHAMPSSTQEFCGKHANAASWSLLHTYTAGYRPDRPCRHQLTKYFRDRIVDGMRTILAYALSRVFRR